MCYLNYREQAMTAVAIAGWCVVGLVLVACVIIQERADPFF